MARRLSCLAKTPLLSFATKKSTSTRRSLSMSLSKLADRPQAFRRPASRPPTAPYWTKRLNVNGKVLDDRSVNPGHTLFISPHTTKVSVLQYMKLLEMPKDRGNAAVIFATPRHASWLTDEDFMANLVQRLHANRSHLGQSIHVLAAVVDGLYPKPTGQEMQEGLSIQFGSLDRLLPGLWSEAPDETPNPQTRSGEPGFESASVSMVLRTSAYDGEIYTVTLPLANTLFHNGRRSTLSASEWLPDKRGGYLIKLRMTEKRTQKIELPMPPFIEELGLKIRTFCPLVPITHPREIVESLGNILAKVDIDGELSPASKEIQDNIPLSVQARQARSGHDPESARMGVWALIIPRILLLGQKNQEVTSCGATKSPPLSFNPSIKMGRLGTAMHKLAFEMKDAVERTAWLRKNVLGDILRRGGRLHQVLSGGGEWGAKASLLSLDPQTTHSVQSEDDELDRFQRSFHGENITEGAIARPGDFVQFFVEGDSELPLEGPGLLKLRLSSTSLSTLLPVPAFGVGKFSKDTYAPQTVDASLADHQQAPVRLAPHHFGAFSAEGLYLDIEGGRETIPVRTKLNAPGTIIHPLPPNTNAHIDPPRLSQKYLYGAAPKMRRLIVN